MASQLVKNHPMVCSIIFYIFLVWPGFSQDEDHRPEKKHDAWTMLDSGPSLLGDRIRTGSHLFECPIEKITSPGLTEALTSHEKLWDFLIDPNTPYCERMIAAKKGRGLFDLMKLPELEQAIIELSYVAGIVKESPISPAKNVYLGSFEPTMVLGHIWVPPKNRVAWPLTKEDFETVPWPWQVSIVLSCLRSVLEIRVRRIEDREARFQLAMVRPCETKRDAYTFAKSTNWLHQFEPEEEDWSSLLEVLSAWRNMALNPEFENASSLLIQNIRQLNTMWYGTEKRWLPQALLLEILEKSPHEKTKMAVVFEIFQLRRGSDGRQPFSLPIPASLTLAGLDYVQKSKEEKHNQLNAAKHLLRVFDDAPHSFNFQEQSEPQIDKQLKEVLDWLDLQRAVLEADAIRERSYLETALLHLPKSNHCGKRNP